MKNSALYIICYCVVFTLSAAAQNQNNSKLGDVIPYQIQVTDRATTLIAFPYSVVDADCGISELHAEKVPGVTNVIKVKASMPNIDTTTLHVFTADGKFYVFQVAYHPTPLIVAYDLRDTKAQSVKISVSDFSNGIREDELTKAIMKVKTEPDFLRRKKREFQIKLGLGGTYIYNNILIIKFSISNPSQLVYQAGLVHMYMRDKNVARRSSTQQLSIQTIYMDSLPCIEGKQKQEWILAIPKTTIPNKKELIFEMQEKNGGRHISISIRNKDLFRAKRILF